MKKITKTIIALVLVLLFTVSFCSCGKKDGEGDATKSEATADSAAQEEQKPKENPEYAGTYDLLGTQSDAYQGYVLTLGESFNTLVLNEDGTGTNQYGTDKNTLTELTWTAEGTAFTMTVGNNTTAGTIKDGIITFVSDETGVTVIYAKKGADTSAYKLITASDIANGIENLKPTE